MKPSYPTPIRPVPAESLSEGEPSVINGADGSIVESERTSVFVGELSVLAGIAAMLIADLWADVHAGLSASHMVLETGAIAAAIAGVVWVLRRWAKARRALEARVSDLTAHLSASRADAARWQAEARGAIAGLGAAIARQFDRWRLTEAERDVALLLLKGLSLREIASLRGTSERTVRQQSLAIYKKAGLSGRAELSAFFLEDLLLPALPEADKSAAADPT